MAKVTFDGPNKLIHVNAGVTSIDVRTDLYSAWKDWLRSSAVNQKWDQVFRTFGGDITSYDETTGTTQYAPRYYFLTNDWRIKVDNGLVVSFESNLYTDREDAVIFIVESPSSVSSKNNDLTILEAGASQINEYGGWVYLDVDYGVSGTTYPVGTRFTPVNNLPDAISLCSQYNFHQIEIRGTVNVTQDVAGYLIKGGAGTTILMMNGFSVADSEFERLYIAGNLGPDSANTYDVVGFADGVVGIDGLMRQCGFAGEAMVRDNCNAVLLECLTQRSDDYHSTFNFSNVVTGGSFNALGYGGYVALKSVAIPGLYVNMGMKSGQVDLYNTCTDGHITIAGIPANALHDDSAGSIVNKISLIASQESLDALQAELQLAQEDSDYGGFIHIDVNSINTGTAHPVGTGGYPVNNLTDAIAIMNARGLESIQTDGDLTIDQPLSNKNITSTSPYNTVTIDNVDMIKVTFHHISIGGTFGTGSSDIVIDEGRVKDGTVNLLGFIDRTAFEGEFFVADGFDLDIVDCFSVIPGTGSPRINFLNVTTSARLNIRRFAGGIRYVNMTIPDIIITASYVTGKAHIEDSNTAGYISVRGLPDTAVNDNRTTGNDGLEVDLTGTFASGPTLSAALQAITYDGRVVMDGGSIYSGTIFPVGTDAQPVNNIADAISIAERENIKELYLVGNIAITQDIEEYKITGNNGGEQVIVYGVAVNGVLFDNILLGGAIVNDVDRQIRVLNSQILPGTTGISGAFKTCGIMGDIQLVGTQPIGFIDCFPVRLSNLLPDPVISFGYGNPEVSLDFTLVNTETQITVGDTSNLETYMGISGVGIPADTIIASIDSATTLTMSVAATSDGVQNLTFTPHAYNVTMVNFVGGATFANSVASTNFIELNSAGGDLVFDSSNTAGTYRITGIADNAVTDNTNGATLLIDTLAASATALNETLQKIDYSGGIYIDVVNGEAGQEWPIGTAAHPCNNLADGLAIGTANYIRKAVLFSDLTIDEALPSDSLIIGSTGSEVITFTGTDTTNLVIENVFATGDMAGYRSRMKFCRVYNLTGFSGGMYDTAIFGDIEVHPGVDALNSALFVDSYTSAVLEGNQEYGVNTSGTRIAIGTVGGGETLNVDFRGFHGSVIFQNIDNANKKVSAHFNSGFVIAEPSCSDGILWLQGIQPAGIVDLSTGTHINYNELRVNTDDESREASKADIEILL